MNFISESIKNFIARLQGLARNINNDFLDIDSDDMPVHFHPKIETYRND